jgi:hypothetical protein
MFASRRLDEVAEELKCCSQSQGSMAGSGLGLKALQSLELKVPLESALVLVSDPCELLHYVISEPGWCVRWLCT